MESLELRVFKHVALEKSVSKAAEKLNYVQSNVTAHIKKLEEELGTVLFIRHSKGMTLTDDGEKLLHYANKVIDILDTTINDFKKDNLSLRIGATQTIAAHHIPVWLSKYQKKFPYLSVSVITDNQNRLLDALLNDSLDCAFLNTNFSSPDIKTVFEFDEELLLVAPLDNEDIETVKKKPIVVNNIETCPYRKLLTNWMFEQNSSVPSIVEFDTVEAILNAVAFGIGISLLPASIAINESRIKTFTIESINHISIQMLQSKNHSNAYLDNFILLIKNEIRNRD